MHEGSLLLTAGQREEEGGRCGKGGAQKELYRAWKGFSYSSRDDPL